MLQARSVPVRRCRSAFLAALPVFRGVITRLFAARYVHQAVVMTSGKKVGIAAAGALAFLLCSLWYLGGFSSGASDRAA